MLGKPTKTAFETYVEEILFTTGGWTSGRNADWDKERALFPAQVCASLEHTQPKLWEEVRKLQGRKLKGLRITALTRKLNALVAKVETAIERLQRYGTVLITTAVTGKHNLREEVTT